MCMRVWLRRRIRRGRRRVDSGTGVAVYSFVNGVIAPEKVLKIGAQPLGEGKTTLLGKNPKLGMPYPAAIAFVPAGSVASAVVKPTGMPLTFGGDRLLVAGNLSDDVWLMSADAGGVGMRFDLSEGDVVPSVLIPIDVKVTADGRRAFVALWNASEVVELDLVNGVVGRKMALLKGTNPVLPGSHPDALALAPDGKTLYVALGNRDAVAALELTSGAFALKGYFDVRLPGQSFYGAQPEALAMSGDGRRLYVADVGSDAVAVVDTTRMTRKRVKGGMVEPVGFVPTEWLPMAVVASGGKLYVASGKGVGTGPNSFAQRIDAGQEKELARMKKPSTYIATLLHGSLAVMPEGELGAKDLKGMTGVVLESNRMRAGEERIAWDAGVRAAARGEKTESMATATADPYGMTNKRTNAKDWVGPIKHVVYIIRENRTYDQILGDLTDSAGKAVGNGDRSLAMYGEDVTPNLHALARQFGVLDNFYDSAEVSGDGHVWSNTAIGTDYLERTWQDNYRGRQRGYDYEGVVSEGLPLEQRIPDVVEPGSGYIWGNVARHGLTLVHFGEFIHTTFCNEKEGEGRQMDPTEGPLGPGRACAVRTAVKPGERLPEVWGGGVNKWPWDVPLIATNTATKPELVGHFATEYPDFNLKVPDQVREDIFERHLAGWVKDRAAGNDTMPNFVMLRLANDHTAGTTPGGPTPKSSIADNDLAVGRAVEAISHTAYWDDTAFFILEDDAQNGADHVDAHRSLGVVVSKYAPKVADGGVFVDSRFYSTVSMVKTMEMVLGLPPMNNNDALSSAMGSLFTGKGEQGAFVADRRNDANGLIYKANEKTAAGAKESAKMDFKHADRAPAEKLNVILWEDAMGSAPVPSMLTEKRRKPKKDDDD